MFFRTLLPKTLTFGPFHKIPIGYFFGHSHTKRSFLKIHHNRLIYSSFFNFFVVFGAPVEAPLHRCAHFNSRLRKSASLEDTFFTKWCSRLSAVLIFTNDSFQNIGIGLVCVTPTAQNGVFMLFSMFVFIVIICFLLLASTACIFLQYIHTYQSDALILYAHQGRS